MWCVALNTENGVMVAMNVSLCTNIDGAGRLADMHEPEKYECVGLCIDDDKIQYGHEVVILTGILEGTFSSLL